MSANGPGNLIYICTQYPPSLQDCILSIKSTCPRALISLNTIGLTSTHIIIILFYYYFIYIILFSILRFVHSDIRTHREYYKRYSYNLSTLCKNIVQSATCTKITVHMAKCTIPDFVRNIINTYYIHTHTHETQSRGLMLRK